MSVRIAPAVPPYPASVSEDFVKIMPPGMAPLALFRTLAKNPRVLRRLRRGGLLDQGSITLRQREIVILRATALAGAEYEWGVHAALFGASAGLDASCLYATVWLAPDAACWRPEESLLLRVCDELHADARVSDELFAALCQHFDEAQLLEVLMLAGMYRAIAGLVNGSGVALEELALRFPARVD